MQHELIADWARHKFKLDTTADIEVVEETVSGGYCETCWYEYKQWEVREVSPCGKYKVLQTFDDDLASILREVLDYAKEQTNVPT